MNLAVIGSGGREHAICYKLRQSPKIKKLICIPGNAGIEEIAENVKEKMSEAFYGWVKKSSINGHQPSPCKNGLTRRSRKHHKIM